MKLAILADVHGNAAALEAVLEDLAEVHPDRVLLNGDLLAFGPEPAETVTLLRKPNVASTRGNADRWLAEVARGVRPPNVSDEMEDCLRWTLERLQPADLRAFTELPFAIAAEPLPLHLYHASAAGDEQGVWPDTPDGEIPGLFRGGGATRESGPRTFVVSHTHRPGERSQENVRVLNTGSVGFPFDGDTRACYLVLAETPEGTLALDWRRVAYDRERTLSAIRERNVPMAALLARRIQTGEF